MLQLFVFKFNSYIFKASAFPRLDLYCKQKAVELLGKTYVWSPGIFSLVYE